MFRIKGILFLTFISCLITQAAQGQGRTGYLIEPMVQWNGNHLSGMLENASLSSVLKDLIAGKSYDCTVNGSLKGDITISFENLTVEELIRKIMHNFRYDYTMILDEPESAEDGHAVVSELTIYQGDNTVRFAKVPKGMLTAEPKRVEPVPSPEEASPIGLSVRTTVAAEEDLEKLDREIKGFMDEMVSEKKMSREEYEKALRTINTERK